MLHTPPPDLIERLHSSRRPLLLCHIGPDGDAIGSLLGLGLLLHKLGKDPILACADRPPVNLRFLPQHDKIITDLQGLDPDLVVALDSSDPSRLGEIYDVDEFGNVPLIVIDHHITNVIFGDVNWVEPTACATAEMIYDLALTLDAPLDVDIATCLLTGLMTDTRGFRTANTTARVLHIASALMDAGASLARISQLALERRSHDLVRLWGRVLDTLQVQEGIAAAANTRAMRADLNRLIRVDGVSSFILGIQGVDVAVVYTELPEGKIECSFRAKPGQDVAAVAFALGGGGHPLASGCTVEGSLEDAQARVFKLLLESKTGV